MYANLRGARGNRAANKRHWKKWGLHEASPKRKFTEYYGVFRFGQFHHPRFAYRVSIPRNLITRVLTICHVKFTQSTVLKRKRFDLLYLSPALRNLWLLLV